MTSLWDLQDVLSFLARHPIEATVTALAGPTWKGAKWAREKWAALRLAQAEALSKTHGVVPISALLAAARYYVRPRFTNIDPSAEAELRQTIAAQDDLFRLFDKFLADEEPRRHLLILADSGTGKSSCLFNYYLRNARRIGSRRRIVIVPLGRADADALIATIPDKAETIVFLDALDEDQSAIEDYRSRLSSLMASCRDFRKLVLTCRTQFFPSDDELPKDVGVLRVGPRGAGEGATYEFWKVYLAPFDDSDVAAFLRKRYPLPRLRARRRAAALAASIPSLTARPMLLAHIPELIGLAAVPRTSAEAYEAMIDAWLKRESQWVPPSDLRAFSEELAVDLVANRAERRSELVREEELEPLAAKHHIPLRRWQLSGRSLLNRDASGGWKFAHRSIMEYLFVKRLLDGDSNCYDRTLTDQMRLFLRELVAPQTFTPLLELTHRGRYTTTTAADSVRFCTALAPVIEERLSWYRPPPPARSGALRSKWRTTIDTPMPAVVRVVVRSKRMPAEVVFRFQTFRLAFNSGSEATAVPIVALQRIESPADCTIYTPSPPQRVALRSDDQPIESFEYQSVDVAPGTNVELEVLGDIARFLAEILMPWNRPLQSGGTLSHLLVRDVEWYLFSKPRGSDHGSPRIPTNMPRWP